MALLGLRQTVTDGQLLEYPSVLQEGCGPATLLRVMQAVAHFEKMGEVPELRRVSSSVTVDNVIKEMRLLVDVKPQRQAPPWLRCMMASTERMVMDLAAPSWMRMACKVVSQLLRPQPRKTAEDRTILCECDGLPL
eukprot:190865-Amphidinium_carterae.5